MTSLHQIIPLMSSPFALRLRKGFRPYRLVLALGIFALCVGSGCTLVFPVLAGALIDAIAKTGTVRLNGVVSLGANQVGAILVGIVGVQALTALVSARCFGRAGHSALSALQADTFARIARMPMAFFAEHPVGEICSRLSGDIASLQSTLIDCLPQLSRQLVLLLGATVLSLLTSVKLGLLTLAFVPLFMAVSGGLGRRIRRVSQQLQDAQAEKSAIAHEALSGIATVKAFANESFEASRFDRSRLAALAVAWRLTGVQSTYFCSLSTTVFSCMLFVLWYGAHLVNIGDLSAGGMTRFAFCIMYSAGAMTQVSALFADVQRARGAVQRVSEILAQPIEPEGGRPALVLPARLSGNVVFQDVVFRYPSRPGVPVLTGLSLAAAPGEMVALVGRSGAGKTTLMALLMRFFEQQEGRICIDGVDSRHFPLHWLRTQIGVVPQEVLLFRGSIWENIAYGRTDASPDEIRRAAKLARVDAFAQHLPNGLATAVGDRGMQLSGGQRQRIAIARAVLKNPAILVLDEATNALDAENESLVEAALHDAKRGRTTFVIAHRPSTIQRADRIVVIDGGKAIEAGTHQELQEAKSSLYSQLTSPDFVPQPVLV